MQQSNIEYTKQLHAVAAAILAANEQRVHECVIALIVIIMARPA